MFKKIATAFVSFSLFVSSTSAVFADTFFVDFEPLTYITGTIHNQEGWISKGAAGITCVPYDHVVDEDFGFESFGLQSLRISDAVTSDCVDAQTFSRPLVDGVGEAISDDGGFSSGNKQTRFMMQFDFASTLPTFQPGMHLLVGPDRGDGSKMSYLRFEDSVDGINIFFIEVIGTSNPANIVETQVGTGLARNTVHNIKLVLDTYDGPSNDVVHVYVDEILVHTGTSWENFYLFDSNSSIVPFPRMVRTVIFRTANPQHPENLNNGFLFDNLTLLSEQAPPLSVPPTDVEQCKQDGWQTFNNPSFKNQGDCVSFVATGGKNPPAGN